MKKFLPKIEAAEQMRVSIETSALKEAEVLRNKIAGKMTRLTPMSIVALAMARFPEQPAEQAFMNFQAEVIDFLAALEAGIDELQAAFDAERERLAPIVASATHRSLDIVARISNIDGRVNANQRNDAERRERFRKAGLTGAELESVAASPTDNSELLAERAALLAESEALQEFLRTRNERHLPDGFAEKVHEAA